MQVAGDTKNTLGTGTFYQSGGLFDYTSITAGAALTLNGAKTDKLEFSIGGGVVAQISVTTNTNAESSWSRTPVNEVPSGANGNDRSARTPIADTLMTFRRES